MIIIAASTKNLKEEMLPELYQRLAQYELYLPSLKERSAEEKEKLFEYFVEKYPQAVEEMHDISYRVKFTDEVKNAILSAEYLRNIRQLRDVINYSIDSAAPLISDIGDQESIYTRVGIENIPFDTIIEGGNLLNFQKRKDKIDKYAE